jgi:16S rRNA (guanine527-N7)-methyltransferase
VKLLSGTQMNTTNSAVNEFKRDLETQAADYQVKITNETIERLGQYYELLRTWNPRLHLVAPCSPREFATRHVMESLLLLPFLPRAASVADIGSGAGLPMIPCLIARKDIQGVLIEASKKKAVFLREALSLTEAESATVIAERFENVATMDVPFVVCRALERFAETLPRLIEWSASGSILLLFGGENLRPAINSTRLQYEEVQIPHSLRRFLFAVKRS